jgi:hypothetical protein
MNTIQWRLLGVITLCAGIASSLAYARQEKPAPPPKQQAPVVVPRLTIEVTGGVDNKPVENASVYLKTLEQHLIKDKKSEVNVKTNQLGIAHIPDVTSGRVLIQVVAEGWKTYGQWQDITERNSTIKIHLDRPPKWY